jgi:ERCC4-related helicase
MDNKTKKINDEIMRDLKIAQDTVQAIEEKTKNPKDLESNKEYHQWRAKVMAYQTFAQELADDGRLLNISESKIANSYKADNLDNPKLDVLLELVGEVIDKDVFKTHGKFASNYIIYKGYGRVAGAKNVDSLKQKINPYILVKKEEEISDQLPELIVTPIYCTMDNKTKKINDEIMRDLKIAQDTVQAIEEKTKNPKDLESNKEYHQWRAKVMAYQTFAQELADDPRLLNMSESKMVNSYKIDNLDSPKLNVLLELVGEVIDNDETVCIFTKFERMQRLLINEISNKYKDINIAYINGSMSSEERYEQAYTLFQDDDSYKVLIMTEAGNAGISLSKCKNLIEYDLADSYANQTQRHGRVRRSDSISKISNIKQIILEESYDEIQQKIINKKEKYDNEIIQSLKGDD